MNNIVQGISAVEGDGAVKVLVLHGWALDSSVWRAAADIVDRQRFTYAYFDFPGYGTNGDAAPADGIDGMARAAIAAADQLGWKTFAVLGHSMGGATAMRVATLAPDRVSAVFALTPVSPGGTPLDGASYESFRSAWPECGPALRSLSPFLTDDQLSAIVSQSKASMNKQTWDAYLANWTAPDFADSVGNYAAPTTLAVGAGDPFVTAQYLAATLSALQDGTLVSIPGAGHYPMVEQTRATVSLWEKSFSETAQELGEKRT
jgi:pimeloyl-ACP methyl ester carboxylesterase